MTSPTTEPQPPSTAGAGTAPRSMLQHIVGALRGEHYDYTQGSLHRAIQLLAIPMVIEMGLESLFAIVDIWWVAAIDKGWFGATPTGGAAPAAVGATEAMLSIVYAIAFGLGMAITATVARRVGERDHAGAARAGAQGISLGLVFAVATGIPCLLFAPDLLTLMTHGNEHIVATGSGYARWLLGGNVIVVLLFLQNAIFRGAGDPILALKTLAVANGINLVLDPCLIFGLGPFPALGVTGAGVATCIGRGTAVLYQTWLLHRGNGRVRITEGLRLDVAAMRRLVALSAGTIGQFLIGTSSWIVLMNLINEYGEAPAAGYTIGIRILMFTLLPAWGLSNAAATLVGQNLGAGQPARAERAVWLTGGYDMVFLALVTVVMEVLATPIARAFVEDAAIVDHVAATLRIVTAGYVFFGWGMVTMQAFNGAGDTATPTWLHFVWFWLVEIPLAYALAHGAGMGPAGIYWSIPLAESGFAVTAVLMFRRGRWQDRKV